MLKHIISTHNLHFSACFFAYITKKPYLCPLNNSNQKQ